MYMLADTLRSFLTSHHILQFGRQSKLHYIFPESLMHRAAGLGKGSISEVFVLQEDKTVTWVQYYTFPWIDRLSYRQTD